MRILVLDERAIMAADGKLRPEARSLIELSKGLAGGKYDTSIFILGQTAVEGTKGNVSAASLPNFLSNNEATVVSDDGPEGAVTFATFFGAVPVKVASVELGISDSLLRRYCRPDKNGVQRIKAVVRKSRRGHIIMRLDLERFKVTGRRKWTPKAKPSEREVIHAAS